MTSRSNLHNAPALTAIEKRAVAILLVEDDDELREGLAEVLRVHGMDVTEAEDGHAFHAARHASQFDVTILDVNLPDTSGFELVAHMADDRRRSGIIMLTARTGAPDRVRGYSEGADLYMTKPVVTEEILLAVRNLAKRVNGQIDTERVAPSPVQHTKSWRLEFSRRRLVAPDGRAIELSGREAVLLQQFVGIAETPVLRQSLSIVLGYGSESRALDVALHRLRQKFTEAGMSSPILTVNNLGFCFVSSLVSA